MARRSTSASPIHSPKERTSALSEDVRHLADVIDALHTTLDRVRDDFNWVIRNGLPIQNTPHSREDDKGTSVLNREDQEEDDDDEDRAEPLTAIEPKFVHNILGAIENAIDDAQHNRVDSLLDTLEEIRNEIVSVIGEDFRPTPPPVAPVAGRTSRRPQSLFH